MDIEHRQKYFANMKPCFISDMPTETTLENITDSEVADVDVPSVSLDSLPVPSDGHELAQRDVISAAWAIILSRFADQEDLCLWTVFREYQRETSGFLRVTVAPEQRSGCFVSKVAAELCNARSNHHLQSLHAIRGHGNALLDIGNSALVHLSGSGTHIPPSLPDHVRPLCPAFKLDFR